MKQIGLDFGFSPNYSLDNYYVANPDTSPINILLNQELWGNHALLITGEQGAGKTHLCHIYANKFNVTYILGADVTLENILALSESGCAVDDISRVDETVMFHLLNMVKEQDSHIVLTHLDVLNQYSIKLPDLYSRLSQAMRITLDLPDDDVLSTILLKHFADRKLRLSSDVIAYIMPRMPRSYSGVSALVEALDERSLQDHSKITVPFVRKVLEGFW